MCNYYLVSTNTTRFHAWSQVLLCGFITWSQPIQRGSPRGRKYYYAVTRVGRKYYYAVTRVGRKYYDAVTRVGRKYYDAVTGVGRKYYDAGCCPRWSQIRCPELSICCLSVATTWLHDLVAISNRPYSAYLKFIKRCPRWSKTSKFPFWVVLHRLSLRHRCLGHPLVLVYRRRTHLRAFVRRCL